MAFDLTPLQKQIVQNRGGNLLVSAAAGSGKTTVLVERLMLYLTDPARSVNIDDFLIITFTNSAAAELRSKISEKLSDLIAEKGENQHLLRQLQRLHLAQISTVHAFCSSILRRYAYRANIAPDFRLLDEEESRLIQEEVMAKTLHEAFATLGSDADIAAFIDNNGVKRDDSEIMKVLLYLYRFSVSHADPDSWLDSCIPQSYAHIKDLTEIPWGEFLFHYQLNKIRDMIPVFAEAGRFAESAGYNGAKAYMDSVISQLESILSCTTWDQLCHRSKLDWGKLSFPRGDKSIEVEAIKDKRDSAKTRVVAMLKRSLMDTRTILQQTDLITASTRGMVKLVHAFRKAYDLEKDRRHVLDYNDLEHRTLDLLMGKSRSAPTPFADELAAQFVEVMVDEYQDANAVQDQIYYALTHQKKNCFMVGDVKQSIYRFRLADPSLFIRKYKDYKPAASACDGEDRKIILGNNFRSGCQVIEAVNSVFKTCMSERVGEMAYGTDEMLYQLDPTPPLPYEAVELNCVIAKDDKDTEEALVISRRIRQLLDGKHVVRTKDGTRPLQGGDIAILSRSVKSIGPVISRELAKFGIRCTGSKADLLQEPEVRLMYDLLQVILNPTQEIPLASVLVSPLFGFSYDDLARLRLADRNGTLISALQHSSDPKAIRVCAIMMQLRRQMRILPICQLLDEIYALTKMDAIYYAMPNGKACLDNLNAFYQIAVNYEKAGKQDLGRFLDYLDLRGKKGINVSSDSSDPDAVKLMTIHTSKGLEFPVVILANLGKGFNLTSLNDQVLCHKELGIGMNAFNSTLRTKIGTSLRYAVREKLLQDELSESIRLLYVAMTRAKERLIMYYCHNSVEEHLCTINSLDNIGCADRVIANAGRMGDWVLLTALRRTESGELFACTGPNDKSSVSVYPWSVHLFPYEEEITGGGGSTASGLSASTYTQMSELLHFRYPHEAATKMPSKRTATQLKGRRKDEEVAENTPAATHTRHRGAEFGNAMHTVMQNLDLSRCDTQENILQQIQQMREAGTISEEYAAMVRPAMIFAFFRSTIGQKMTKCTDVLREFKFSVLEDASRFDETLEGEKVLLQGVVDMALVEDDGITVVDFKTDLVTLDTLDSVVERYAPQVKIYAEAMQRIYEKPVKQAVLYFFRLNRFVKVI